MDKKELTIRESSIDDVAFLAERLRPEDVQEILDLNIDPLTALKNGFLYSSWCFTGCDNGVPMAMLGICGETILGNRGMIWFVGTERLFKYPFEMVRVGRKFIAAGLEEWEVLWNYTDSRYEKAIHWLTLLGMEFKPELDIVSRGVAYNYFEIRRK